MLVCCLALQLICILQQAATGTVIRQLSYRAFLAGLRHCAVIVCLRERKYWLDTSFRSILIFFPSNLASFRQSVSGSCSYVVLEQSDT